MWFMGNEENKILQIIDGLKKIIELDGQCVYGTADLVGASDEIKEAFRCGSAVAFSQAASIAREILNSKDNPEKTVERTCEWTNKTDNGNWKTSCGVYYHRSIMTDHCLKCCPKCGGKIVEEEK